MDFTDFVTELDRDFTEVRLEHAGGALILPSVPVDLEYLCAEVFPDECDADSAYQAVGSSIDLKTLITFEWREDLAAPWSLSLEMLIHEGRAYVTIPPDPVVGQPWEAFAAVRNPEADEILDALLFDLLWDNGETYSVELLSSLPTSISSDVLGKETVRAAFHLYLDWDEMRTTGAWREAAGLLPSRLTSQGNLAGAAAELVSTDSETNRDRFIEAYVDVAFGAA